MDQDPLQFLKEFFSELSRPCSTRPFRILKPVRDLSTRHDLVP